VSTLGWTSIGGAVVAVIVVLELLNRRRGWPASLGWLAIGVFLVGLGVLVGTVVGVVVGLAVAIPSATALYRWHARRGDGLTS
jgi:hypothetical protein